MKVRLNNKFVPSALGKKLNWVLDWELGTENFLVTLELFGNS